MSFFKFLKAKWNLDKRFTYTPDKDRDTWTLLPEEGDISGDCEDYALCLQRQLGGNLWIIPGDPAHVVLVVDGWTLDNRYALPYRFTRKDGYMELPQNFIEAKLNGN